MKQLTNGFADNWLDRCYRIGDSFFYPAYASLLLMLHFDALNWVVLELLLVLPLFFRLYGFGVQQKLGRFYNTARNQLIIFLIEFGVVTVICSSLQITLPQSGACMVWDGIEYSRYRNSGVSPSSTIALLVLLTLKMGLLGKKLWLIYTLIVLLISFFSLSAVFGGVLSLSQVIRSICVGAWTYYTFQFMPPIFIPVFSLLTFIWGIVTSTIDTVEQGIDGYSTQASGVPAFRGAVLLIMANFLYFRFVKDLPGFRWISIKWGSMRGSGSDGSTAIIPEVITSNESLSFGERLSQDILDAAIAFVVVIGFNLFVSLFFKYELFSIA